MSVFSDIFIPHRCVVLHTRNFRAFPQARVFRGNNCREGDSGLCPPEFYIKHTTASLEALLEAAKQRIQALRLQPRFADVVDAYMDRVPSEVVGLHVRRTDLRDLQADSDKKLKAHLDMEIANDPDIQFLLCTDARKNVEWLKELYGDRILWRAQWMQAKGKKRDMRHSSIADAAIDLYCLARTSRIIGTDTSSFTDYAAILGDKEVIRII